MSEVRVGCSSWTSPAWKGRFYPPELPDGDRLAYYARYFDVVEVDATYYRAPSPYVVRGWARKTPEGFRFAVKFPRDLLDPKAPEAETAVAPFVESVQLLGAKLGPVLLQFPPWFKGPRSPGTGFADFLERRVRSLPSGPSYAVELREAGWFAPENRRWLERLFAERGIASCWSSLSYVDVPAIRTTDWVYLRFIGDHDTIPEERHGEIRADRTAEVKHWIDQLKAAEVRSAMAFFNNHFAGYAPESVNLFRRALGLPTVPFRGASSARPE